MGQQVRLRFLRQVLDEKDDTDGEGDAARPGCDYFEVPSGDHTPPSQSLKRLRSPFITLPVSGGATDTHGGMGATFTIAPLLPDAWVPRSALLHCMAP